MDIIAIQAIGNWRCVVRFTTGHCVELGLAELADYEAFQRIMWEATGCVFRYQPQIREGSSLSAS